MKKLIVQYDLPADPEAFLRHYRQTHLPLVRRIPGLVSCELTRVTKTLAGRGGSFLVAEMSFADDESFRTAMRSPENAATGADLANFAEGLATILVGETWEP